MLVIVRHYKFCEEVTTFNKLGIGVFFITEAQLNSLGNSAIVNIKTSADGAVSLNTGGFFKLADCTRVHKGR